MNLLSPFYSKDRVKSTTDHTPLWCWLEPFNLQWDAWEIYYSYRFSIIPVTVSLKHPCLSAHHICCLICMNTEQRSAAVLTSLCQQQQRRGEWADSCRQMLYCRGTEAGAWGTTLWWCDVCHTQCRIKCAHVFLSSTSSGCGVGCGTALQSYLVGEESQICLFGVCLLMT